MTIFKTKLSGPAALMAATMLAAPAATAQEVTLGVLVPLTGELGEFGEIVAGAIELGVEQVNAAAAPLAGCCAP